MQPLAVGDPAPDFRASSPSLPDFAFNTAAGRFIVLAFLPADDAGRHEVLKPLAGAQTLFDGDRVLALAILRDPRTAPAADLRGLKWMADAEGKIGRLYGAPDAAHPGGPSWILVDPSLRIVATAPRAEAEAFFAQVRALPHPNEHAGTPLHAPVLIAPRVFEPEFCARLIALYEAEGGRLSGVARDVDGRTVGVFDEHKRRSDVAVADPAVQGEIRTRLARRLLPQIERAFATTATRMERYTVACYDAEIGGFFRPHRDNTTAGAAHRKFAASINLNDDFEGGDLRFPEFGRKTYRPPLGGAVVFACGLLHEALPVTAGRRYAFLPFLFDEAGAALRDANRAQVDASLRFAAPAVERLDEGD